MTLTTLTVQFMTQMTLVHTPRDRTKSLNHQVRHEAEPGERNSEQNNLQCSASKTDVRHSSYRIA